MVIDLERFALSLMQKETDAFYFQKKQYWHLMKDCFTFIIIILITRIDFHEEIRDRYLNV
jgi:hypothetical protein